MVFSKDYEVSLGLGDIDVDKNSSHNIRSISGPNLL